MTSIDLTSEPPQGHGARGGEDDEGHDKVDDEREDGVELLLPLGRVRAVGHALVELLHERALVHVEDQELQKNRRKGKLVLSF